MLINKNLYNIVSSNYIDLKDCDGGGDTLTRYIHIVRDERYYTSTSVLAEVYSRIVEDCGRLGRSA